MKWGYSLMGITSVNQNALLVRILAASLKPAHSAGKPPSRPSSSRKARIMQEYRPEICAGTVSTILHMPCDGNVWLCADMCHSKTTAVHLGDLLCFGMLQIYVFCCAHAEQVVQHLEQAGWLSNPNCHVQVMQFAIWMCM
jgi:hypothetical protein